MTIRNAGSNVSLQRQNISNITHKNSAHVCYINFYIISPGTLVVCKEKFLLPIDINFSSPIQMLWICIQKQWSSRCQAVYSCIMYLTLPVLFFKHSLYKKSHHFLFKFVNICDCCIIFRHERFTFFVSNSMGQFKMSDDKNQSDTGTYLKSL